jgi:leucyl aminopeptidase
MEADAARACDPAKILSGLFRSRLSGKFASLVEVLAPEGTSLDQQVIWFGKSSIDIRAREASGIIAASLQGDRGRGCALVPGAAIGGKRREVSGHDFTRHAFDKYKTKKDKDEDQNNGRNNGGDGAEEAGQGYHPPLIRRRQRPSPKRWR